MAVEREPLPIIAHPVEAPDAPRRRRAPDPDARWQNRLLPYMMTMLAVVAIFFLAASIKQVYDLQVRIERTPELDLKPALASLASKAGDPSADKISYARWKTLATLEGHALEHRYHQANVLLSSRVFTSYLGFVTGMIVAMVGATFILGKLREPESALDLDGAAGKVALKTASPGLVMVLLGTVLMVTTIVSNHKVEVTDTPIYTTTWQPLAGTVMSVPAGDAQPFSPESLLEKIDGEIHAAKKVDRPAASGPAEGKQDAHK